MRNVTLTTAITAICVLTIAACSDQDGVPIVLKSRSIDSPSKLLVATIEEVDNGLGFGQGMIYDEIHVSSRYSPIGFHGDKDSTVVFYAESNFDKGNPPEVTWISDDKLVITLDPSTTRGKRFKGSNGLTIEYRVREQNK